jgi:dTDP-4-dehydrorhamnose reductase
MKILLFGKNGQLGWELQRSLAPLGELVAVDADSEDYCGDFANLDGITQTIRQVAPEIIVNAAAYTAVDKAEKDSVFARILNTLAPAVLAREAKRSDAWLIHYSTDYVFDGSGEHAWKETDSTNPLSVYGKTKLEGDVAILESGCKHLIFRTSWVYAAHGGNFVKTMVQLAQVRDQLQVINDQFGAPTGAELLADATAHCLRQALLRPEVSGIYHIAASGVTSWFDYARFVIEFARKAGFNIKVAPDAINPIPTSAFPLPAVRPANSRLDTHKLQTTFNLKLPEWQHGVSRMLMEISERER